MTDSHPSTRTCPEHPGAPAWWRGPLLGGALVLLLLTVAMYGRVLFAAAPLVVSTVKTDIWSSWYNRAFAFENLRRGHLPLWNPYILSGNPYLGDFQTTLLYPLNWPYMLLPIAKAINLEAALHVYLGGLWMYWWALRRRLHPLAGLVAASAFMFGAPLRLQVFAGHLNPVDAACWIPLLFLISDELRCRPGARFTLIGAAVVALQILTGFPQYVFYALLAVVLLTALEWSAMTQQLRAVGCLLAMYLGGAAISAAQLFTAFDASRESSRSHVAYSFASSVSLPPENFLTWLSPSILGDVGKLQYWGRWEPWEVNLYMGGICALLALWALAAASGHMRGFAWKLAITAALLLLFALGCYTPVFHVFYDHVPGFGQFRVPARFAMPAAALLAMLAGVGLDAAIDDSVRARPAALWGFAAACLLVPAGLLAPLARHSPLWPKMLLALASTHQAFFPAAHYAVPSFVAYSLSNAIQALTAALALWAVVALVVASMPGRRFGVARGATIALLAIGELFVWSYRVMPGFDLRDTLPMRARQVLQSHPGDYRYFRSNTQWDNSAMGMHTYDIWGYESLKLRRYSEFMAWTQGDDPNQLGYDRDFTRNSPLWSMLRCRYVFEEANGDFVVHERNDYLPHVLLLSDWRQIGARDAIFSAMAQPGFDPRREVILESRPDPMPAAGNPASLGSARVVESGTDFLTIDAAVARPAILLVTDAYARGWHAVGLLGGVGQNYTVMPANYILRAIPLRAGNHRIRLYYLPIGFVVGAWVSIVSLLLYAGLIGVFFCRRPQ